MRMMGAEARSFAAAPSAMHSPWCGAIVAFLIAAAAMAPVLHAGFQPEDFGWLALARLNASPWPLLTHNIDFVYFYRPLPLLLWWLTAHAFGTEAVWHNLIDILLHATNAALVGLLAARLSRNAVAGTLAGAVFATLPAAVGTAVWASDRFDPMALGFALLALLAFEDAVERRRSPIIVGLLLLFALLSKETAYVAAAIMLVRLAAQWFWRLEFNPKLLVSVLSATALALMLRQLTSTTAATALDMNQIAHNLVSGVIAWWRQAPSALVGFLPANPAMIYLMAALLMIACVGIGMALRTRAQSALVRAWIGLGCLLLPALVQWPVTAEVLTNAGSRAFTENLRFYYAASAGLALLLAIGFAQLRSRFGKATMAASCLLWSVFAFAQSHAVSAHWAQQWGKLSNAYLRLGTELGQRSFPPGCRIYLDVPAWPDVFRAYADNIVKARAGVNASLQACAIFAGKPVYQTIVPAQRCTAQDWPGLELAQQKNILLADRIGNVCILQFANYRPDQLGAPLFRFRVDADGHATAIAN